MNNANVSDEIQDKLTEISVADILVGIPSYNNANTIGHVVRAVHAGLAKYFPDKRAVLVNSDGGSTDNTMEVVQKAAIDDYESIFVSHYKQPFLKLTSPYHGIPGKGSAFRMIFEIARLLNVKACAVLDSDLRSITPEWVDLLLKPVMQLNYDFVAPYYFRHKYDGTITNSFVYPLTRTLYGKRIRQPIGGDFAFSGELAAFFLEKDVWNTDVARYGIDIWMTTTALANNFRICQSFLGAKIHDSKDPSTDLSDMLYQVIGSTFNLMETYFDIWKKVDSSSTVPTFGFKYEVGMQPVTVNTERMIEKFRLGAKELVPLWKAFMPRKLPKYICEELCEASGNSFHMPDEIWVDIVHSFALAWSKKVINRQHLLKSLTPLYIGKVASFVIEAQNSNATEVEELIEKLCVVFESKKKSLIRKWSRQIKKAEENIINPVSKAQQGGKNE